MAGSDFSGRYILGTSTGLTAAGKITTLHFINITALSFPATTYTQSLRVVLVPMTFVFGHGATARSEACVC